MIFTAGYYYFSLEKIAHCYIYCPASPVPHEVGPVIPHNLTELADRANIDHKHLWSGLNPQQELRILEYVSLQIGDVETQFHSIYLFFYLFFGLTGTELALVLIPTAAEAAALLRAPPVHFLATRQSLRSTI